MYQAMYKARARASLPVNTRLSASHAAPQENPEVGLELMHLPCRIPCHAS